MVKTPVDIRDVGPVVKLIRNFLLGRSHTLAVRFQKDLATRSPPPPKLPDGPSHQLSVNYYYSRDARREVAPPLVLVAQKQIGGETLKARRPGSIHKWD